MIADFMVPPYGREEVETIPAQRQRSSMKNPEMTGATGQEVTAQEPNLTLTTYSNEEEAFIKHNPSSNKTNPELTTAPGQDTNDHGEPSLTLPTSSNEEAFTQQNPSSDMTTQEGNASTSQHTACPPVLTAEVMQMVQTRLGEIIMEHNPPIRTTELEKIITNCQLWTGGISKAQNVGIEELAGEALGARLKQGTIHKRGADDMGAEAQLELLEPNKKHKKTPSRVRYPTEDPADERCARERRQLRPPHNAQLKKEHDAYEMSGKSPGKRKRHSSDQSTRDDRADELRSSETVPHEVIDSADEYENEGELKDARRVKPNTSKKLKQHSSEVVSAKSPKSAFVVESGGLNIGLTSGREESITKSEGDAPEHKVSHGIRDAPKKERPRWGALDRYKKSTSSSLPDYGPDTVAAPAVVVPQRASMPSIPGGPKPYNRLGNKSNNPPFAPPKFKTPGHKAFNLTGESESNGQGTSPRKRQKVDTSSEIIDVESDRRHTNGRRSTAWSGQSQSQNGYRKNDSRDDAGSRGVEEYRNVEETIKAKQGGRKSRQNSSSDGLFSNAGGSTRYITDSSGRQREIVRLDEFGDHDDPIDDTDMNEHQHHRKSTLQVQIPKQSKQGGYQGTAFNKPARLQVNGRPSRGSMDSPAQSDVKSQYFAQDKRSQQRRQSSISNSATDEAPSRNAPRVTRQQAGTPTEKNDKKSRASAHHSYDDSVDDLSTDHYRPGERAAFEQAQKLLVNPQQSRKTSTPSRRVDANRQSIHLEDSSDEESTKNKADIQRTDFGQSTKTKQKKTPGEVSYDVFQAFSESHKWSLDAGQNPWSLRHNVKEQTLSVFNANGRKEFDFPTTSIERIQVDQDNGKTVIHKSRDQSAQKAIHIYLALRDVDQGVALAEHLQSLHKTIGVIPKTDGHLDRVFANIQSKLSETKRKRPLAEEEPDDVKLARLNKKRRNEKGFNNAVNNAQENKRRGSLMDVGSEKNGDSASNTSKPRNIARSMRNRSSPIPVEDKGPSRARGVREVPAKSFYGSYDNGPSNAGSSHGTRSSARVAEQDPASRQTARLRSPSPQRWTVLNPNWADGWHSSVVYPREGKKKATVDKQDIERLDEGEFLNDNLIMFYLLWLETHLSEKRPDLAKRIYFQNTFFYERLTKTAKGKKGINYEAVARWTARVDLLSYDYIIVPVNEHSHWYVAIICNAPKLLKPNLEPVGSSQPQDEEQPEDQQEFENAPKSSSASPTSMKQRPISPTDSRVNSGLEEMSLEDKDLIADDQGDLPEPDPALQAPSQEVPTNVTPPSGFDGPGDSAKKENADDIDVIVTSDLQQSPTKKSSQTKKGKRKSLPTPRKYNPTEPRIITLDSLGIPHSPTCSNLRDYLVEEIKAKHGIDIPRPTSLGMTAKHIPQQDNYCDCGLFLLSYIEMFLNDPDEFIHDVLQHKENLDLEWPKASAMRNDIRDLLFDLQKTQVSETGQYRTAKGTYKREPKVKSRPVPALFKKSESHKSFQSARASADRSAPGKSPAEIESPRKTTPELPKKAKSANANGIASADVQSLDEDVREDSEAQDKHGTRSSGWFSGMPRVSELLSNFCGQGKANEAEKTLQKTGPSLHHAVEIPDSPEKSKSDHRHHARDSPSAFKHPEATESQKDLHSPLHVQETSSDLVKNQDSFGSPDREHHQPARDSSPRRDSHTLSSPSPEPLQDNSNARGRRAIPYTPVIPSSQSQENNDDLAWNDVAKPEETLEDDSVQLLSELKNQKKLDQTGDASANDAEMLLSNDGSQEESARVPDDVDPGLLPPLPLSSPVATPAPNDLQDHSQDARGASGKERRSGRNSVSSSPVQRLAEGGTRPYNTFPPTPRKRKNVVDLADDRPTKTLRSADGYRDPSDQAIVGKHGSKHIRFSN